MKELDKNRVLCTDLKLNREYKDDLMSLIDKLKFLASYKKKVALRPKRKEKREYIDKLKKKEEILSNNNFEEVVTQMEFDSSSFITSNQQQTQPQHQHQHEYCHEIKDSVQKVVEWKRITNNYINTNISAEIKIKKPRDDGNISINNSITYDEQSTTNEKKNDRVTKVEKFYDILLLTLWSERVGLFQNSLYMEKITFSVWCKAYLKGEVLYLRVKSTIKN